MKHAVILSTILFSASSFALNALPNGSWGGNGHANSQAGQKGDYTETLTIKNNVATSRLQVGDFKATYVITYQFNANGFFTAVIEEKVENVTKTGHGYCGTTSCHVEADDHSFEMTTAFVGDKVYELGSDNEPQRGLGWFESTLSQSK